MQGNKSPLPQEREHWIRRGVINYCSNGNVGIGWNEGRNNFGLVVAQWARAEGGIVFPFLHCQFILSGSIHLAAIHIQISQFLWIPCPILWPMYHLILS